LLLPEVRTYNKLQPELTIEFRKKNPRSPVDKFLTLRNVNVWQDIYLYDTTIDSYRKNIKYFVNEASFALLNNRVINPFNVTLSLQQGNEFVRTFAEFNYKFTYGSKNKGLFIRAFAGGFLWNYRGDYAGSPPNSNFQLNFSTG